MKKFWLFGLLIAMMPTWVVAQGLDYDEEMPNRQYVGWGIGGGANVSGFRMQLPSALGGDSVRCRPSVGVEVKGFLDYHISDRWYLRFNCGMHLSRARFEKESECQTLTSGGVVVAMPFVFHFDWMGKKWMVGAGPYSNFIVASHITHGMSPYRIEVAQDPEMGRKRFAIDDWESGLLLMVGFEVGEGWQWVLDSRVGMLNQLNFDTGSGYLMPWSVSVGVARTF